jgi:hypothetical protein
MAESPIERMVRQRQEEEVKLNARRDWIFQHGSIFVQISPRRWLVVKYAGHGAAYIPNPEGGGYPREQFGRIMTNVEFGPATYEECEEWLRRNDPQIPAELL